MEKNKVLIIRFSSFGDIVQCSSVVECIRQKMPEAEIHWATRGDFEFLVQLNQGLNKVWGYQKKTGILGLLSFGLKLKKERFTHVYDAHNNLRSKLLKLILRMSFSAPTIITRSKDRWKRILLFKFRKNLFPTPFRGIDSYIAPLKSWGIENREGDQFVHWEFALEVKEKITKLLNQRSLIALVPSAAHAMKRWPLDHWKELIRLMPAHHFVVLGGKEDTFCSELAAISPAHVENLAGKLSLVESSYLIQEAALVISADTGLLHVADALGVKGISLMGPSAFGFTKSSRIITMEVSLPCRPCSKDGSGRCSQEVWQRCMVEITPTAVSLMARKLIRE